jgi:hypothetical protein
MHSPIIPLGRRSEPIVIDDNDIICGICNNNIVRDKDMGHIISDGCKCNLNYHYNCLLTMWNRYVQRKRNMKCSMSQCQKQIYAITNHEKRDLIGELQDANNKCCLCQDGEHYHIELGRFIPTNIGGCKCKDVTWHFQCLWSWYNKDLNFHNRDNIIGSRDVQFAEGILRGSAGHIYIPAQCDFRKNVDMLSL